MHLRRRPHLLMLAMVIRFCGCTVSIFCSRSRQALDMATSGGMEYRAVMMRCSTGTASHQGLLERARMQQNIWHG